MSGLKKKKRLNHRFWKGFFTVGAVKMWNFLPSGSGTSWSSTTSKNLKARPYRAMRMRIKIIHRFIWMKLILFISTFLTITFFKNVNWTFFFFFFLSYQGTVKQTYSNPPLVDSELLRLSLRLFKRKTAASYPERTDDFRHSVPNKKTETCVS